MIKCFPICFSKKTKKAINWKLIKQIIAIICVIITLYLLSTISGGSPEWIDSQGYGYI